MNDRSPGETFVTLPARRLGQGEVNLHVAAAETETFAGFGNGGRHICRIEQAPVELRGRDVADDRTSGSDGVAAREPDSGRTTSLDENPLHVLTGFADATVISDQARERVDEPCAAPTWNRHAPGLDREGDHAGHEPRRGCIGAESRVENPRREQAVRALGAERRRQPVSAALDDLGPEPREPAAP